MIIEIENTSSPGASFTPNTNSVLLKIYEWINENKGETIPFVLFRRRLEREKGVNDNNNRNIFPLLKNCGMVSYEPGHDLQVDFFYTKLGLAYVKTLESIELVKADDYTEAQKVGSIDKFEKVKKEIIYKALFETIKKPDINYAEPFSDLIRFLIKYNKICKQEYAYMLYVRQKMDIMHTLNSIENNIISYRNGDLTFETIVKVNNDLELREKIKSKKRKEGLSYLTSYGYFTSLLQQAGLITKYGNYQLVIKDNRKLLEQLGGIRK